MKLRANDTLHISSVQADNLVKGDVFELPDAEAASLIERGLATEVDAAKAAKPVANKMAPAPKNKAPRPRKAV